MLDRGTKAFDIDDGTLAEQEQVAEPQRMVGPLAMELAAAENSPARRSTVTKDEVVQSLSDAYPVRMLCTLRGLAPSPLYYAPHGRDDLTPH